MVLGHGKRTCSGGSTLNETGSPLSEQHMYFLEGGLLVANHLLRTDAWVQDDDRSHCNVCVQQFLPFRRRHHCRTCGEVVCSGCSSQRSIRLTDVNVECSTRVCTYCIIHATDASIRVNETALRETNVTARKSAIESFLYPLPVRPPTTTDHRLRHQQQHALSMTSQPQSQSNHLSIFSVDSAFTDGSVVQLWPQPEPADDSARLQVACHPAVCARDNDPTMNLLVRIIARTLECPVAFVGILDEASLWFKASVGWTRAELPRDDCVAAHTLAQAKTLIVGDSLDDKHFHASDLRIDGQPMRFYAGAPIWVLGQCIGAVCALDVKAHTSVSAQMTSTLESVAKIASEVLEQRVSQMTPKGEGETDADRGTLAPASGFFSASLLAALKAEGGDPGCQDPSASQIETAKSSSSVDSHDGLSASAVLQLPCSYELRDSECLWLDATAPGRSSYYTMLQPVPPEYGGKISLAMDLLHRLQSQSWSERSVHVPARGLFDTSLERADCKNNDSASHKSSGSSTSGSANSFSCSDGSTWVVKTFETVDHGRLFTRTNTKLAGDCAGIVAQLLNYEDARIYLHLFSYVKRRFKLNDSTWMDEVAFRPGVLSNEQHGLRVLSHWRQYPDGSNVIVAVDGSNLHEADQQDLLFGWFVAPSRLDDGSQSVTVSSIVAQPFENQSTDQNLSLDLTMSVNRSTPVSFKLSPTVSLLLPESRKPASPSAQPSTADPTAQDSTSSLARRSSTASYSDDNMSFIARSTAASISMQQHGQTAQLNDSERLMFDLLDKTISTQEILAAQQSEMAGVIDLHGAQLQRISTAIERVESMLADKATRRRRGAAPRHSLH